MSNERISINRVVIALLIAALTVVALLLVWRIINVILIIFGGILLAIFLRGLSVWTSEKTRLPANAALALIGVVIALTAGLSVWYLAPKISNQVSQLSGTLPQALSQAEQQLSSYSWANEILAAIPSLQRGFFQQINVLKQASSFFSLTFTILTNVAVILFVGIYMAINPSLYQQGLLQLIPVDRRDRAHEVLDEVGRTLLHWLTGRLITMTVVTILSITGLMLLGVPLALTLGVLSGMLSFVPYIGPLLSVILPAVLAISESPTLLLYVLLLYAAIQFIESYFITPLIQERAVSLPPALTISAQVILGLLIGTVGLIFATPLVAVLLVLVKRLYVEDVLHNSPA